MPPRKKSPEVSQESVDFLCRTEYVLDILSAKWTAWILRELFLGPVRSRRFLSLIPGLNMKTLRERLQMLEDLELITRTVYADKPLRVEYGLTEKGRELYGVLVAIKDLGNRWLGKECHCPFDHGFAEPENIQCPHRMQQKLG